MFGYIPDYLLAIRKMDDVFIIEEAMMVPVVHRRFKSRRDFMEFSDKEFYELTRFTKEGATWVTDRLDNYLSSENRIKDNMLIATNEEIANMARNPY